MKRGDLLRYQEGCGRKLGREGSRHSIYLNPENGKKTSVPRHVEIDNCLVRKICKQLDVPKVG
jgi:mRNA interferase HicA